MNGKDEVIARLRSISNPDSLEGMGRFGINTANAYGVSIPSLRSLAKEIGKDHALAQQLWSSRIHEARILATMIDDPLKVSERQMEEWARDFDSWDVCDQCCSNLLDKTEFAHRKAVEWSRRDEEFVRRAGFVLMATLAVHDKESGDEEFVRFLRIIERQSADDRNFVKKATNWALRQIGKRDAYLNEAAIRTARSIAQKDSKAARWVASDAIRELTSEAVQRRLSEA
jgi:3-methyladenine DNA glycosylase AlkD